MCYIIGPQVRPQALKYKWTTLDTFFLINKLGRFVGFFFRHQRNKLKLDDVPKLPEWQRLRLQHCSNDMSVPNLVQMLLNFYGRNLQMFIIS
jgi:hypothetical protein